MSKAKIDRIELNRLLNEGKSQAECSRIFGVSEAAITKAVRRFNLAVAQDIVSKQAPDLVKQKKGAMDYLMDLAKRCDEELKWIEDNHPPSDNKDYQSWQDQKIKHIAEIRKVINSMSDIRVKIYHTESVERALGIIMQEVGKENAELQGRIRARLQKRAIDFVVDD